MLFHEEREVAEEYMLAESHCETLYIKYVVAGFTRGFKREVNGFRKSFRLFDLFHAGDGFFSRFRRYDVALAVPASLLFDVRFETGDFLLL